MSSYDEPRPVDSRRRLISISGRLNGVEDPGPRISLEQRLHRLGGVAERATLVSLTCRADVDRALREGRLIRVRRGRYALPTAAEARRAAGALSGTASHRSAAAHWGWEMKTLPRRPIVTVARSRRIGEDRRHGVEVHWSSRRPDEVVDGWVTSPARTFVDCCRDLPFDEALAIADSALRHRDLSKQQLIGLATAMRGPGRARCIRVAKAATARAENPFESVLRAIALDVPGLRVRPQVLVVERPSVRPDLSDDRLRLAIEADSFEWHGNRRALMRDCRRYNLLGIHGWWVLRYSWEDVMLDPGYVAASLAEMVTAVQQHAQRRRSTS